VLRRYDTWTRRPSNVIYHVGNCGVRDLRLKFLTPQFPYYIDDIPICGPKGRVYILSDGTEERILDNPGIRFGCTSLATESELPDDGAGGKAEKRRLRKENKQCIRDQNVMRTR